MTKAELTRIGAHRNDGSGNRIGASAATTSRPNSTNSTAEKSKMWPTGGSARIQWKTTPTIAASHRVRWNQSSTAIEPSATIASAGSATAMLQRHRNAAHGIVVQSILAGEQRRAAVHRVEEVGVELGENECGIGNDEHHRCARAPTLCEPLGRADQGCDPGQFKAEQQNLVAANDRPLHDQYQQMSYCGCGNQQRMHSTRLGKRSRCDQRQPQHLKTAAQQ